MLKRASITFLIAIILISSLSSCSSLLGAEQKIVEMNLELKRMLHDRYMLYIDNNIIFVEGHYDNAFQDNSIHLTLKIPDSSITGFYNDLHYSEEISFDGGKRLIYDGELYTYIDFFTSEDGYIKVIFNGRYPGSRPGIRR